MAFNGRFVLNMAHFASQLGASYEELISKSEMTVYELGEEECVVSDSIYNSIVEECVELTGDQFFGLHAGENLNLAAAGLIYQIVQTSETVKQALDYCCEFANLGCRVLPLNLVQEANHYKVTLIPDETWRAKSEVAFRQTAEGVVAFTIKEFHSLTRFNHNPIKIEFPWAEPEDISEYKRVYNCSIEFNKPYIAIHLRKEHVDAKVVTADFNLLGILVSHAHEKSARLEEDRGFASMVKQSVIKLVKPKFPTVEDVASHLFISPRTLQRKLKEEGFTFKVLIDELKMDFAISYLKRGDLSVSEVAYLLSYSDVSTFSRSFKRWTGQSPNQYRAEFNAA